MGSSVSIWFLEVNKLVSIDLNIIYSCSKVSRVIYRALDKTEGNLINKKIKMFVKNF